jgi:hypothetical protein
MPSILCLLGVWLGVALAVRLVSSGKPTAATTLALLETRPGAAESTETRRAWIASIAARLAGLDLDARHLVLMDPRFRAAFSEMSAEDQAQFLTAIETPRLREFIEGTKAWNLARFDRVFPPALADLEEIQPGSGARFKALVARPAAEAIAPRGIEAFPKDTDPLTRFDTRPLIERVQKYSQLGR